MHLQHQLSAKTLWGWDPAATTRSPSSSWLDGLRGVAAVQVFFFHFFGRHTFWGRPFASSPEDMSLHQLIFIRPLWAGGSGAVSIFFCISGYVLTIKSFSLIRRKEYTDLFRGLCSSVFRRWFRLYLPVLLLAIPTAILSHVTDMTEGFMYPFEVKDNVTGQIAHFLSQTDDHFNPFSYKDNDLKPNRYGYVPTSWTIPMEYYGSLVCYLMILVVAFIDVYRTRIIVVVGMAAYSIHRGSWWTSNFLVGMAIADWTLERRAQATTLSVLPSTARYSRRTIFYIALCCYGYYLTAMPPDKIPFDFHPVPHVGYEYLYKLYPPAWVFVWREPARWWWYWSGNLVFLGVSQVEMLQAIYNTRFCQWLGKLSFALYLCHAMVMAIFSRPVQGAVKAYTQNAFVVCFVEFAVETPVIIMLSVLIEKYMDAPSVQFARWLEDQVLISKRSTEGSRYARPAEQQESIALMHPA